MQSWNVASITVVPAAVAARRVLHELARSPGQEETLGRDASGTERRIEPRERPVLRRGEVSRLGFELTSFQRDAVDRADAILAARGGVLIADSVGLGKTYIALALIERCIASGAGTVLVTAPAALRSHWMRPLRRLAEAVHVPFMAANRAVEYVEIESAAVSGGMHPGGAGGAMARTESRTSAGSGWIRFLPHTALVYARDPLASCAPDLVVVDESHAFRNARTQRARTLAHMCRHGRVVLLSATPINNSLSDMYVQLRFFLGDGALADIGIPDLRSTFRSSPAGARDPDVARAVRAVAVRRTRAYVVAHYGMDPMLRFPRRAPPVPVLYESDRTAEALDMLGNLDLVPFRFRPAGRISSLHGGPELVRYVLLKRLESGSAAFRASTRRLVRFLEAFERAALDGRLLSARDHRSGGGLDGDQLQLEPLVLSDWPPGLAVEPWIDSVRADLERLRALDGAVRTDPDAKIRKLESLLDGPLAGVKVLVFTEFRETARQLSATFARRPGVARIDGSGAWLASGRASRAAVIAAFSPVSSGSRLPREHERVDVLIATDVLSEGLDLQDAGVVVSYDLPWNPVRLIQRIGRIDRLGSRHDVIRTYNFVPDGALESVLGLLDRIEAKLSAIRHGLGPGDSLSSLSFIGRDTAAGATHRSRRRPHLSDPVERERALSSPAAELPGGTARVVAALSRGDPDLFDAIEREHELTVDGLEPGRDPVLLPEDDPIGAVAVHAGIRTPRFVLCTLRRKGLGFVQCDHDGRIITDGADPVALIESFVSESLSIGSGGETVFDREALAHVLPACVEGPDRASGGRAVVGIVRRLSRLALAVPGGLDAEGCARLDRILRYLGRGLRRGIEAELERLVAPAGRPVFDEILDGVERVLDRPGGPGAPTPRIRLVAAFDLRPPSPPPDRR